MLQYIHAIVKKEDSPENWVDWYGVKFEIIGFSFNRDGSVDVELYRLTKRPHGRLVLSRQNKKSKSKASTVKQAGSPAAGNASRSTARSKR